MIAILTPQAQQELEAIGDYIALDNPARAESFVEELLDRCTSLATFPERFPIIGRYAKSGTRRCLHGDYLIFYRIEADQVTVIHILHGAVDYGPLLGE